MIKLRIKSNQKSVAILITAILSITACLFLDREITYWKIVSIVILWAIPFIVYKSYEIVIEKNDIEKLSFQRVRCNLLHLFKTIDTITVRKGQYLKIVMIKDRGNIEAEIIFPENIKWDLPETFFDNRSVFLRLLEDTKIGYTVSGNCSQDLTRTHFGKLL